MSLSFLKEEAKRGRDEPVTELYKEKAYGRFPSVLKLRKPGTFRCSWTTP